MLSKIVQSERNVNYIFSAAFLKLFGFQLFPANTIESVRDEYKTM